MRRRIRSEIRLLRWLTGCATGALVVVAATTLLGQGTIRGTKFEEITVERINVIEPDGRVRLVVANSARQADAVIDGRVVGPGRNRPAGMIFFNEVGDEVGGLIFSGRPQDGRPRATASLTFDQWKQDQTIALQYVDQNGQRRAGLAVIDRPETSLVRSAQLASDREAATNDDARAAIDRERDALRAQIAQRMFVGKDVNGRATLALADAKGRERLVLAVDQNGSASVRFLDAAGKVVKEVVP